MRAAAFAALGCLFATDAVAGDVLIAADGELALAVGTAGQGGLGGGAGLRVGYVPKPLQLGPVGLDLIPEGGADYHILRRVDEDRHVVRGFIGGRVVFSPVMVGDGYHGFHIDTGLSIHGGLAYVLRGGGDNGLLPSGDVGTFVDVGGGPIVVGVHLVLGATVSRSGNEGVGWIAPGAHIGLLL